MAAINYRDLKRHYELDGPQRVTAHLSEALRQKQLRSEDFSLRDLAEALVPDGHQWIRQLDPRNGSSGVNLLEAGDGVDVTAFLNITGQVIYSKIMEAYQQEAFIIFNTQVLRDAKPYWAVATNVTAQYQGDLEPAGWISASRLLHCEMSSD